MVFTFNGEMEGVEVVIHPIHASVDIHQSLFAGLTVTERQRLGDALGVLFELAQAALDSRDASVGDPDARHDPHDVGAGALDQSAKKRRWRNYNK